MSSASQHPLSTMSFIFGFNFSILFILAGVFVGSLIISFRSEIVIIGILSKEN